MDVFQKGAWGVGLARKDTWLPPGEWVDVNSGVITNVASSDDDHVLSKNFTLNQVPLWYVLNIQA